MSGRRLSIAAVAARWSVGWDFVARRKVELQATRFGRVYRIPESAVEEYELAHRVAETPAAPKRGAAPVSRFERLRRARELAQTVRAAVGIRRRA